MYGKPTKVIKNECWMCGKKIEKMFGKCERCKESDSWIFCLDCGAYSGEYIRCYQCNLKFKVNKK